VRSKGGDAGADRIATRHGGGSEGRKPNRGRNVRHDSEVKHEQVNRDQRNDQTALSSKLDHHAGHKGGDDNVIRRGRQPHSENQTDHSHPDEHEDEYTAGDEFDELRHDLADAGQCDRADDHSGSRCRDRNTDHVAGARDQTREHVEAGFMPQRGCHAFAAKQGLKRFLRGDDNDHEQARPERGQTRRCAFHHQKPHQHDNREHEINTGWGDVAHIRQVKVFLVRIVKRQVGCARGTAYQDDVGPGGGERDNESSGPTGNGFDPVHTEVHQSEYESGGAQAECHPSDLLQ
jgi:hypothetical protein